MLPISPQHPWLAPLAGWSDLAFRLMCRRQGAAVACSEMISAKGLVYQSFGTESLLKTNEEDNPLVMQLFGAEAEFIAKATHLLVDQGCTLFDVNMGCSVPKVTKTGAGAALLKNHALAFEVAKAIIEAAKPHKVGFKLRLGWDHQSATDYQALALGLEKLGAAWLTLHPRTAKQGFSGKADWGAIKTLKNMVSLPVIASGDLMTAEDGLLCLEQTGADSLMYGRGALRDTGIFAHHACLIDGKPYSGLDLPSLLCRLRSHIALMREHDSDRRALLKMRTIIPRTTKAFGGTAAKVLRLALMASTSWVDVEEALQIFEHSAQEQ